jgi:hypothetical protein
MMHLLQVAGLAVLAGQGLMLLAAAAWVAIIVLYDRFDHAGSAAHVYSFGRSGIRDLRASHLPAPEQVLHDVLRRR